MNDLKILWKYFREHKLAAMAVVAATFSGAVAGCAHPLSRLLFVSVT